MPLPQPRTRANLRPGGHGEHRLVFFRTVRTLGGQSWRGCAPASSLMAETVGSGRFARTPDSISAGYQIDSFLPGRRMVYPLSRRLKQGGTTHARATSTGLTESSATAASSTLGRP